MTRSINTTLAAASLAALLCACAAPKPAATTAASTAQLPTAAAGAPNAPIPPAGAPGAIPLDETQRGELDRFVAVVPPPQRTHLRYALALGDDGKRHLVVYDGGGLSANGRAGAHDFIVFKVLNANDGSHYDPQSDELVAPVPPPPEREGGPGGNG